MASPCVTVCVPTWQSEAFIDKTLWSARNQTHRNLRILVGVDGSTDRTAEICEEHAAADRRVEVISHRDRMGWARNVNSLIDRVDSGYFFLFMHDDLISSRYVETLLDRLVARPDAVSVQCDVLSIDRRGRQTLSAASAVDGPSDDRAIRALLDPTTGAPLRALIRSSHVDSSVRFAESSIKGWNAHVPFQFALLSAGTALHIPEVLYWRPTRRRSGVVSIWGDSDLPGLIADQQVNARQCLDTIGGLDIDAKQAGLVTFALYVTLMRHLRRQEVGGDGQALVEPTVISHAFDETLRESYDSRGHRREVRRALAAASIHLRRTEAWFYLRRNNVAAGFEALRRVRMSEVGLAVPELTRRQVRRLVRWARPLPEPAGLHPWELDP